MNWGKIKELLGNGYSFSMRPVADPEVVSVQMWKGKQRTSGVIGVIDIENMHIYLDRMNEQIKVEDK